MPAGQLLQAANQLPQPEWKVRFAIVNPVSQQAILRAVADTSPPDKVGEQLRQWEWKDHTKSNLYQDAKDTANRLCAWQKEGYSIEVHVYSSSIACAVLLTEEQAFLEQYMYGRSRAFQPGYNLGGEYPVVEYDASISKAGSETVESEIIRNTFDIIWKYYSISWGSYLQRIKEDADFEQKQFERNLALLREELSLEVGGEEQTGPGAA